MKPHVPIVVLLFGVAASRAPVLADSFTFTTIDVPGSTSTMVSDINNTGQIVGTFHDSSGSHGFLDTNGAVTPINFPRAMNTTANGLNDAGEIVGTYDYFSFLDNNGVFTHLTIPSEGEFTDLDAQVFGINNLGQIVGSYPDPLGSQTHGFIYDDDVLTNIIGFRGVHPYGINNSGQVVGEGIGPAPPGVLGSAFFYDNGTVTTTESPGALTTQFDGINDSGEIVGQFLEAGITQSFVYANGTFQPIAVPGATNVFASGINNAGDIVGGYDDTNGNLHGFLATTVIPEPASFLLATAGLAVMGFLIVRKMWREAE